MSIYVTWDVHIMADKVAYRASSSISRRDAWNIQQMRKQTQAQLKSGGFFTTLGVLSWGCKFMDTVFILCDL